MKQDEAEHAEKIEQTLASINKNLEKIAKSLEKMEPKVYELPKYDFPCREGEILDISDVAKPVEEEASKSKMPDYYRDCLSDTFKP